MRLRRFDACQSEGASPLGIASLQGLLDIVKLLLDHGADVNQAPVWASPHPPAV